MKLPRSGRRVDRPLLDAARTRHPKFKEAVLADVRFATAQRGEAPPTSRVEMLLQVAHLVWASDAFGALVLYRVKASCQAADIPVVPRLAHRIAIAWAQLSIGDPVVIHPGVLIPHGQVVIDGFVEIHSGVRIRPFVTIGLKEGTVTGPIIHRDVKIGTGAKIFGPLTIGERAVIGANAVVVADVAPHAVMAGVAARRIR